MVLEAVVMCLDNSEWMRNGDYTPSRLEAQADAINLICSAKTGSNPENTVGVIACAGRSPEVLVTLTADVGKILSSLHEVKLQTKLNFVSGIQVAQLALKHRQNKNQHQRVVFFVGSPIDSESEELVRLGKRLKKNNIAVDIVNFGEESKNTEKLEAFIGAVTNNENSHLVTIPPGPHILSDILISSPILTGGEDGGSSGTVRNDFGFGIDPNLDPELALALKVSMEEERARQEAARKKEEGEKGGSEATPQTPSKTDIPMHDADDEESLLARAIAMSMQEEQQQQQSSSSSSQPSKPETKDAEMKDLSEDDEMALALQLSMAAEGNAAKPESADINKVMEDPNFVHSVLSRLPGVNPNDDSIKNFLASMGKPDEKKDDKENEKK